MQNEFIEMDCNPSIIKTVDCSLTDIMNDIEISKDDAATAILNELRRELKRCIYAEEKELSNADDEFKDYISGKIFAYKDILSLIPPTKEI